MVKVEDFKLNMELDTVTAYDSKKKESIVYYNVPCSFDIETTIRYASFSLSIIIYDYISINYSLCTMK